MQNIYVSLITEKLFVPPIAHDSKLRMSVSIAIQKHLWTSGGNRCKDNATAMISRFAWIFLFVCHSCREQHESVTGGTPVFCRLGKAAIYTTNDR